MVGVEVQASCQLFGNEISIVNMCLLPLPKLLGRMDPVLHLERLYEKKNETLRIMHIHMHTCVYAYVCTSSASYP